MLVVDDQSGANVGNGDAQAANGDDSSGLTGQKVVVLVGIVVMLLLVGAGLFVSARRRRRD
ncbi:unannotated protein [freshwater metagenome]|uniref:Unannotated protein n=1 Tax=freshwater metagenome TaxID=449393 RepID=A0A6J6MEQ1_9ZZZZ|nr:LPXTG cell wall anchor domain-containing protein [Actinomycetota bacterium]